MAQAARHGLFYCQPMKNQIKAFVCLFLLAAPAPGLRAATYFDGTVYEALDRAREKDKLLMVEFYADWNYKSKWMNTRILADSAISAVLDRDYIVVQVDTRTTDGAQLAVMYQVSDYPSIVVFNSSGQPLDKIDQTLDRQDFLTRLDQISMSVSGSSGWRLKGIFSASENGDTELADRLALDYLASRRPEDIIDHNHWRMFTDNYITFYGSATFEFLMSYLPQFMETIGEIEVSDRATELFTDKIIPHAVGTQEYDSVAVKELSDNVSSAGIRQQEALLQMLSLAAIRHEGNAALFTDIVGILLDKVNENSVFSLLLSLEYVVENGSRDQRQKAARIVNRFRPIFSSNSQRVTLDDLYDRLRGRQQTILE